MPPHVAWQCLSDLEIYGSHALNAALSPRQVVWLAVLVGFLLAVADSSHSDRASRGRRPRRGALAGRLFGRRRRPEQRLAATMI
jgi:hypothetical protein